jgi:pterin-4a-carbinolamine dehydratase
VSETVIVPQGWTHHERPPSLFRRFTFAGYGETRAFLDRLGSLSGETGCYPDISFGRSYANVTVHARDGKALGAEDLEFARRVNEIAPPGAERG